MNRTIDQSDRLSQRGWDQIERNLNQAYNATDRWMTRVNLQDYEALSQALDDLRFMLQITRE